MAVRMGLNLAKNAVAERLVGRSAKTRRKYAIIPRMSEEKGRTLRLELNGLSVDCIIGEKPGERVREQRLSLDVALEIVDAAARSDSISDTVDYAALGEAIRAKLVAAKCRMIERAARLAAEVCMEDGKVMSATVRVTKAGAVAGLASASAAVSI